LETAVYLVAFYQGNVLSELKTKVLARMSIDTFAWKRNYNRGQSICLTYMKHKQPVYKTIHHCTKRKIR